MEYEHRTRGKQTKPKIRPRVGKPHPNPINFDHHILGFRNPNIGWVVAEEYAKRPREVHSRMAWLREQLGETKSDASEMIALGADDLMTSEELQELQVMFGRKRQEDDVWEQLMFYNHMAVSKMLNDVGINPKHPNIRETVQSMYKEIGEWGIRKYLRDPKNVETLKQMISKKE